MHREPGILNRAYAKTVKLNPVKPTQVSGTVCRKTPSAAAIRIPVAKYLARDAAMWASRFEMLWLALLLLLASSRQVSAMYCEDKDCYTILGLTFDDAPTDRDIKKAYRKLSLVYHPDKNKAEDAEDKFVEIANAYEILSDDQRKKDYDYYVLHPEDFLTNQYNHFSHTYAPQVDVRVVLLGVLLVASAIHYYSQTTDYTVFLKALALQPDIKERIKAAEEGKDAVLAAAVAEMRAAGDELAAAAVPNVWRTPLVSLPLLPYTVGRWLWAAPARRKVAAAVAAAKAAVEAESAAASAASAAQIETRLQAKQATKADNKAEMEARLARNAAERDAVREAEEQAEEQAKLDRDRLTEAVRRQRKRLLALLPTDAGSARRDDVADYCDRAARAAAVTGGGAAEAAVKLEKMRTLGQLEAGLAAMKAERNAAAVRRRATCQIFSLARPASPPPPTHWAACPRQSGTNKLWQCWAVGEGSCGGGGQGGAGGGGGGRAVAAGGAVAAAQGGEEVSAGLPPPLGDDRRLRQPALSALPRDV
jgi:hypothetical protein